MLPERLLDVQQHEGQGCEQAPGPEAAVEDRRDDNRLPDRADNDILLAPDDGHGHHGARYRPRRDGLDSGGM
jgi:hypothetical protein